MAEDDLSEHKLFENTTTREQIIDVLLASLFSKCPREKEHSSRVSHISVRIAKQMGLSPETVETIRLAGVMHDIDKVAIDDGVLSSVSRYSSFAKDVLANHEKWDGTGYPRGLKGDLIPLTARIIAVADAFDAMLCERPYHKPMTLEEAKQELLRCSSTQFDPEIVSAFLKGFAEERV
jgi:HD-GYP domain-containing protein (c-di-GMP phosphodiesterase class II)